MSEAGTAVHFHAGDGCPSTIDRAKLAREFARLAPHFPKPLARVDALNAELGTEVELGKLDGHQKRLPAKIVKFAAYDPEKTRPRS